MPTFSRRKFLSRSGAATLGTTIGLSGLHAHAHPGTGENKLKIVVVGAHPDDPETMCGGAMALYATMGHEVV